MTYLVRFGLSMFSFNFRSPSPAYGSCDERTTHYMTQSPPGPKSKGHCSPHRLLLWSLKFLCTTGAVADTRVSGRLAHRTDEGGLPKTGDPTRPPKQTGQRATCESQQQGSYEVQTRTQVYRKRAFQRAVLRAQQKEGTHTAEGDGTLYLNCGVDDHAWLLRR